MLGFNNEEIASRIRELIAGQDGGEVSSAARLMGVDEAALRMSIDPSAPHPTLDVLGAVVTTFGVDPSWLMTGVYDPGSHHEALAESTKVGVVNVMRSFVANRPHTPPDVPLVKLVFEE